MKILRKILSPFVLITTLFLLLICIPISFFLIKILCKILLRIARFLISINYSTPIRFIAEGISLLVDCICFLDDKCEKFFIMILSDLSENRNYK